MTEPTITSSRRRFLQSTLLAGGGLSLPRILELQAAGEPASRKDTAVIQVWLGGGPSQFETFDPKPDAPAEIRGPYSTIGTKLPGIRFCEKMPRTAGVVDRASIIRSVTHTTNGHFVGAHWLATGYPGTGNIALRPSVGSIASQFRGPAKPGLPAYVLLSQEQTRNPIIGAVMGPGHLSPAHAPFTVLQSPFEDAFDKAKLQSATANLTLADDLTFERLGDRRALLERLDKLDRAVDTSGALDGVDQFHQTAFEMVTSSRARRAFELDRESAATHALYGSHRWGQMALLARRLVEAGVTFVTINTAPDSLCWDWHRNIVNDNRPADGSDGPNRGMDVSGPPMDQMVAALVTDLYERGLDKRVLLVVWGEFGRTPRVNKTGGRDHWGALMSILLAGGGTRTGQVLGASNSKGEAPTRRPIRPEEVLSTIYRHLGIDTRQQTITRQGRPIAVLGDGEPIAELF